MQEQQYQHNVAGLIPRHGLQMAKQCDTSAGCFASRNSGMPHALVTSVAAIRVGVAGFGGEFCRYMRVMR
jgi:hypothetical protein